MATFSESNSSRNVVRRLCLNGALDWARRVQATASIDDVLDEAMLDVRELDPAVENVIGDDKPLLEAWRSACHIERHPSHKPKPTSHVPPTTSESES